MEFIGGTIKGTSREINFFSFECDYELLEGKIAAHCRFTRQLPLISSKTFKLSSKFPRISSKFDIVSLGEKGNSLDIFDV